MKIAIFFLICLIVYLLHRLCLLLEKKGYLYYLHRKPEKGIVGSALEELNGFLNPAVRHTIEMKRNEAKLQQGNARDKNENEDCKN